MEGIITKLNQVLPKLLLDFIKNKELSDMKLTDYEFLAVFGHKRNWKKECAICLTEDIMGTTCSCGHSICANPCFENFAKSNGIILKPQKLRMGNQVFNMGGQKKI